MNFCESPSPSATSASATAIGPAPIVNPANRPEKARLDGGRFSSSIVSSQTRS